MEDRWKRKDGYAIFFQFLNDTFIPSISFYLTYIKLVKVNHLIVMQFSSKF